MGCRGSCSTATATWWSRRAARRASTGCAPRSKRRSSKVLGPATLVWKNDSGARELEGPRRVGVTLAGAGAIPAEVAVREQGVDFVAPLARGQKTGWFYDQTANRERLRRYLPAGRARARCVQLCRRMGHHRAQGRRGAARPAWIPRRPRSTMSRAMRAANGVTVETVKDDAFDALKALQESGARFDVVILDPPAFAKRKKDVPQAQAAYRKLNQLALPLIDRDGILVSCSCSYHMAADDLAGAIQAAARHYQPLRAGAGAGRAVARSSRCIRRFPKRAT